MKIAQPLVHLPLVLACAVPPGAQASASPIQEAEASSSVLRFGDPETLLYDEEFFPGTEYDPAVTRPEKVLGQLHGSRLSHHAEVLACVRAWANE